MQRPRAALTSAGTATLPLGVDDGLGLLDHDLEAQRNRSRGRAWARARRAPSASAAACSGICGLGSMTTNPGGRTPPVASRSVVRNRSSVRTARARVSSIIGLMRMPMNGGSVRPAWPRASLARARRPRGRPPRRRASRRSRPRSRCAGPRPPRRSSLCDDPRADLLGELRREVERPRQRRRVRRVLVQSRERELPELARRVRAEEVRSAVEGVHGLAVGAFAGVLRHECSVGRLDRHRDAIEVGGRQGRPHASGGGYYA